MYLLVLKSEDVTDEDTLFKLSSSPGLATCDEGTGNQDESVNQVHEEDVQFAFHFAQVEMHRVSNEKFETQSQTQLA